MRDLHSLLHAYKLTASECQKVNAYSDLHSNATLRLKKTDYAKLCNQTAGEDYEPIIALFATANAREAVHLRSSETLYVQINSNQRNKIKKKEKEDVMKPEIEKWQPLTVTASHAFVKGMRVSGTIHRSIVRLNRYIE